MSSPKPAPKVYEFFTAGKLTEAMELQRGSALAETPCKGGTSLDERCGGVVLAPAAEIDNGLGRLIPRTPYEEAGADGSHSCDVERNVNWDDS